MRSDITHASPSGRCDAPEGPGPQDQSSVRAPFDKMSNAPSGSQQRMGAFGVRRCLFGGFGHLAPENALQIVVARVDELVDPLVEDLAAFLVSTEQDVLHHAGLQCLVLALAGLVVLVPHDDLEEVELFVRGLDLGLVVRLLFHDVILGGEALADLVAGKQLADHRAAQTAAVEAGDGDVRENGPDALDQHFVGQVLVRDLREVDLLVVVRLDLDSELGRRGQPLVGAEGEVVRAVVEIRAERVLVQHRPLHRRLLPRHHHPLHRRQLPRHHHPLHRRQRPPLRHLPHHQQRRQSHHRQHPRHLPRMYLQEAPHSVPRRGLPWIPLYSVLLFPIS